MKRIIYPIIFTSFALLLSACGNDINITYDFDVSSLAPNTGFPEECTCREMSMVIKYQDFENTLLSGTNIVVAQLVERRPFGHTMEELEFIITDQLYGQTSDRIFIYLDSNVRISVSGSEDHVPAFREADVEFEKGVDYLLTLRRNDSVVSHFRDYAYFLMNSNLIVNLDEPTESTMFSQPLEAHATELDFSDLTLTADDIIEFVIELVDYDDSSTPAHNYNNIRSSRLEDLVNYSPIIVEIEINELIDSHTSCNRAADWFRVTVVDSLKGDFEIGYYFKTIFFMGVVNTGERHIMTLREGTFYPMPGTGLEMHMPTSRHGVINTSYFNEIVVILNSYTPPLENDSTSDVTEPPAENEITLEPPTIKQVEIVNDLLIHAQEIFANSIEYGWSSNGVENFIDIINQIQATILNTTVTQITPWNGDLTVWADWVYYFKDWYSEWIDYSHELCSLLIYMMKRM